MQLPRMILTATITCLWLCGPCLSKPAATAAPQPVAWQSPVSSVYCAQVFAKVDAIVRKNFVDSRVATVEWPEATKQHKKRILASRTTVELDERMNALIKTLHTSHCEFATPNDEICYFLRSLFSQFGKKRAPLMTFTGAITGGVNCGRRQARHGLDGSPASASGILPGDEIIAVDGRPYVGQLSFSGTAGRTVMLTVKRNNSETRIRLKPELKDAYSCYVEAIEKSVRVMKTADGVIGYVHLWSGG